MDTAADATGSLRYTLDEHQFRVLFGLISPRSGRRTVLGLYAVSAIGLAFAWWTWSRALAQGNTIRELGLIPFLLLTMATVFVASRWWHRSTSLQRAARAQFDLSGGAVDVEFTWAPGGCDLRTPGSAAEFDWREVEEVHVREDVLVLVFSRAKRALSGVAIPWSAFTSVQKQSMRRVVPATIPWTDWN